MPAKFKRCVKEVQAQGKSRNSSYAICTAANAGGIKQVRKREARRAEHKKRWES